MSPRTGRPPVEDKPRTARMEFRLSPDEKEEILKFLKEKNMVLLDLVRIGMKHAGE